VPSGLLIRVVFGLLVIATAAAFFVTQRLKQSTPAVQRVFFHPYLSPNGDGRKDSVRLRFDLERADDVTVSIVDRAGYEVRRLADDRRLASGTHRFGWDGRAADGQVAAEGAYRLRVALRSEGRSLTASRTLILDTTPPRLSLIAVTPATIAPDVRGPAGRARIRYAGPSDPAPRFTIYRTDARRSPEPVLRFRGPRFRRTAKWDGRVRGRPAPDGIYAVRVTVQDKAGNLGSRPATAPPTAASATAGTGVSVRYLTASGPLVPVRAGTLVRVSVGPVARSFRWSLARLGRRRALIRGRGSGMRLALRLPLRARTGVYLLRIAAGAHRTALPLVVQGPSRGAQRPLVVLPALTWQGSNRSDDDSDGFADTLESSPSVSSARPLARGLPPAFRKETAPLISFLDRYRERYDLTTDLALVRGEGPGFEGRRALVFAGSTRWLTERIDVALREYVEQGGRVASFGTDAFRRRLGVSRGRLITGGAPEDTNVFGERTTSLAIAPAPLVVTADRVSLFAQTDGFLGLFTRFEQSAGLVAGAKIVAAAGREAAHPSLVAYRLGRGLVIRVGARGWGEALARQPPDRELERVTRRIWTLLSR